MEFPLDPNMAEWVKPRLNRRNPHELHWRRQPPDWQGSINKTHGHLYSHLADETCCMQCGAVPCPFDHEEHKRMKLADLEFVKELVKERKELKLKVNQLETMVKNMEDKLKQWREDRRLMTEKLGQFESEEREWERQRRKMEEEIDRIKMLNVDASKRIQAYKKDQEKLRVLSKRVQDLEKENSSLSDENERYKKLVLEQGDEIQSLETTNRDLAKQNEQTQYHMRKLRVELDDAHEELTTVRTSLAEKVAELAEVKASLDALTQELCNRVRDFNARDELRQRLADDLRHQVDGLRARLEAVERENSALRERVREQDAEIRTLRAKMARDGRFRKFVSIKREYNELKEKNESLMLRVYEHERVCPPVQFMTSKGRVKSAAAVRRSVSPPGKRPVSASVTASMLGRPKWESRSLASSEDSHDGRE